MELKKEPLQNEKLIFSIHRFMDEKTAGTQRDMMDLIMQSKFWIPAKVTPAPKKTSKGTYVLTSKNKVSLINAHQTANGEDKSYYIAFTDAEAFKIWANGRRHDIFTAEFDEIAVMLLRPTASCNGMVINPGSANIRLTTHAIKEMVRHRENAAAKQTETEGDDGEAK